jgi:predicted phage terminase large subunit-like protein
MGITKDETIIIEDVWRGQKEFPDVHEIIVQNATIDGRKVAIRLEAEKAGIVALQQMLRESRLRGYKLDAKPPEGDKYTRAGPFASRMNAGKVKLVRGGWNRAFLDECSVFPVGNYADQVDAASGAYQMLSEKGQGKATRVATRGLYSGRKSRDNDRFNP